MTRSARSSSPEVNDPALLPESVRVYYRSTWGFDPVTGCRILGSGGFRYEECFPLPQDLPLKAIGVMICARVEWEGKDIHNRIVFRRGDTEGVVECTHTIMYAGPAGEALKVADNIYDAQDQRDLETRETIRPNGSNAVLPPWEHFAALKSYVAAVSEAGVLALSFRIGPENDLPFGFNAMMLAQIVRAIRVVAPEVIDSLIRDLAFESLDEIPSTSTTKFWDSLAKIFPLAKSFAHHPQEMFTWLGKVLESTHQLTLPWNIWKTFKREILRHRNFLLKKMDTSTLLHYLQQTVILDDMQDKMFTDVNRLERVKALAPHLPWDQLHLEWQARKIAYKTGSLYLGAVDYIVSPWAFLESYPAAEVWPRFPFITYDFPHRLLRSKTGHEVPVELRRARVEQYCQEVVQRYTLRASEEPNAAREMIEWATKTLKNLETLLVKPFPIDRIRSLLPTHESLSEEDLIKHLQDRGHVCAIPSALQKELAVHWDFATRLALVGNPGTTNDVLNTLTRDPQSCVRAAASARLRRKEATILPLVGEILDPGEMLWFLSTHPRIFFQFGVTTWGDGSAAYADWFATRPDDENFKKGESIGKGYAWGYTDGYFSEWRPHPLPRVRHDHYFLISPLATRGWTFFTCGHLPCVYLGTELWVHEANVVRMREGIIEIIKDGKLNYQ